MKLLKWLFWVVLIIYLFAGHFQVRYWVGESFGWQFNEETESLEVRGFGQIIEGFSIIVACLMLYGVYYLWKEASKNNDWEPLFDNTKNTFKKIEHAISPKNIYNQLKRNIGFIGILFGLLTLLAIVGIVIAFLMSIPIIQYIVIGFYALFMIVLFIIGRD